MVRPKKVLNPEASDAIWKEDLVSSLNSAEYESPFLFLTWKAKKDIFLPEIRTGCLLQGGHREGKMPCHGGIPFVVFSCQALLQVWSSG